MLWKGKIVFVLLLVVICTACSSGRDFVRPTDSSFVLGKTTIQEIRQHYGEPSREESVKAGATGEPIKLLMYSYAFSRLRGLPTTVRVMSCFFHNDILVGYDYKSDFPEDNTNFDETKINRIIKGVSQEREIISLIGNPTGRDIYPLTDMNSKSLSYNYMESNAQLQIFSKFLLILLDKDGIVTDIKFVSNGRK